ncbi:DUF6817 domain-containing protein [Streptomyces fragilis]|uniref:DUF6817 domain-containing protein n=1 Tax=Streptomyces fragilis TaxID=67301 RepID=A0ABV2YDS0_9ACTN|nr:hypothetical protein [Streptomyces fragilis]
MPAPPPAADRAVVLLRRLGADAIAHPGGTLLQHLVRVRSLLVLWGARPELQLAGLCHAAYGTEAFAPAVLGLARRAELALVIGPEAESLVHLYGVCDRAATYPTLTHPSGRYVERFTGRTRSLSLAQRRDLAELIAADELDLAWVDPLIRARRGAELMALLLRLRPLLSPTAWRTADALLTGRRDTDPAGPAGPAGPAWPAA